MIKPIDILVEAVNIDEMGHYPTEARVIGTDNLTLANKINEVIAAINNVEWAIRIMAQEGLDRGSVSRLERILRGEDDNRQQSSVYDQDNV